MKTVALLSGGKDSVYNLLHCILHSHEPVCVASLGPEPGLDEIDSYMYQTVGHSGLASIAQALHLRFFQGVIKGKGKNLGGRYGDRKGKGKEKADGDEGEEGDETEDLYRLLKEVKIAMPEVEAVACGAILSNYQRVRVEHVCTRLGLTPLAYLWERNQEELLGEMVKSGLESVLVKVAGAGLGVEHLGKSLKEMHSTLLKLNQKYQLHVCGEGGEYETFTLDSPIFSSRVNLTKTTTVITNPDPYSTIAHLHLDQCVLETKPSFPTSESFEERRTRLKKLVTTPPLLSEEFEEILDQVKVVYEGGGIREGATQIEKVPEVTGRSETRVTRSGEWVAFSEVVAENLDGRELSLEEEVRGCFTQAEKLLSLHSATLLSLSHLTVYLSPSSMSLFPQINKIYSTYFGTSPPTRACVSVILAPGQRLKLEGLARIAEKEEERKSLHVQSLSYWSAANIGPYSQSVASGTRLTIAGQIPLIPATLTLPYPFDFPLEVTLSLQHLKRIEIASEDGRWKGWFDSGICWIAETDSSEEWMRRMVVAKVAWEKFTEDERVPMAFVSATSLPRGASIEWQVTGLREPINSQEDEESDEEGVQTLSTQATLPSCFGKVNKLGEYCAVISAEDTTARIDFGEILLIRAFHLPSISIAEVEATAIRVLSIKALPALSTIAVKRLATVADDENGGRIVFVVNGTRRSQ